MANNDSRSYNFNGINDSNINVATDGSTITLTNNDVKAILEIINSIKPSIAAVEDIDVELQQEIAIDLEEVQEEIQKEEPDKKKLATKLHKLGKFSKAVLAGVALSETKKVVVVGIVKLLEYATSTGFFG